MELFDVVKLAFTQQIEDLKLADAKAAAVLGLATAAASGAILLNRDYLFAPTGPSLPMRLLFAAGTLAGLVSILAALAALIPRLGTEPDDPAEAPVDTGAVEALAPTHASRRPAWRPTEECVRGGRFYAISHLIAYRSAQEYVEALKADHDIHQGEGAVRGLAREVRRRAVIGWRKFRCLRCAGIALGLECALLTSVTLLRLLG